MQTGPLILGASGKIGRLMRAGAVHVWDTPPHWQYRDNRPAGVQWDVLLEDAPSISCSGILMFAGGVDDPADMHVALARAACDFGEFLGVPVLLASSQAVYGKALHIATEKSPVFAESNYARAKLAMEASVAGRPNVCCLRIGNVVGADLLMRTAAHGPVKLDQWPDGTGPLRSMIGPIALAAACQDLLACTDLPPILNLAQPGLVSMQSLLEVLDAPWSWVEAGQDALHQFELDVSLAQTLIPLPDPDPAVLVAEARKSGWDSL